MVTTSEKSDIVLDILARLQEAVAEAKGELTPELAKRVETKIRADWGGDRVYIYKARGERHAARNSRIQCEYRNGEHLKLLARRYGLNERQVMRIIKETAK